MILRISEEIALSTGGHQELRKRYEPEDSPFHVETVSSIDQLQNVEHSLSEKPGQQKLIVRGEEIGNVLKHVQMIDIEVNLKMQV